MMKTKHSIIKRICIDGMMTAIYIALTFLVIKIGDVHISFAALPIAFVTLCIGLPDGLIISFLGIFAQQMIEYGFGPTTFLWIVPHLVRVLVLYLFHLPFKKKGSALYDHIVWYFVGMIVSALFLTAFNTAVMYLDGLILGYPVAYTAIMTIIRFATGMASNAIVAIVLLPVIRALKKNGKLSDI